MKSHLNFGFKLYNFPHTHAHTRGRIKRNTSRIRKDEKKKLDILDVTIKVMVYKENQNYFIHDMALKKKRKNMICS